MTAHSEAISEGELLQKAHPLLSICVPTYNRSRFLAESLACLEASLRDVEVDAEIIIFDNASPDDTPEVLEEWRNRFRNLKTWRHRENVGAEANIAALIQAATGHYVWFMGDDDKISPDFFRRLIKILETRPDMVVLNYSVHSADFSTELFSGFIRDGESRLISCRSEALANFGVAAGFISAIVLTGSSLKRVDGGQYLKFSKFGLGFLYAVYAGLPERCRLEYVAESLVHCRGGNSKIDWENVFLDGVKGIMQELFAIGFSKAAISRAKSMAIRDYVLQYLGSLKVSGKYTGAFLRRCFSAYGECAAFWYAVLPLAVLPSSAVQLIKKLRNRNGKN